MNFEQFGEDRFDDPRRGFGVCYVGLGLAPCVAETVLGKSCCGRLEPPDLDLRHLADRQVCRLDLPVGAALRLVDLTGAGLLRLGADARLLTDVDYAVSQAWSRALWEHPERPDGILYRSRYDPDQMCVALFDRARDRGILLRADGPLLRHPELPEVLRRYGTVARALHEAAMKAERGSGG